MISDRFAVDTTALGARRFRLSGGALLQSTWASGRNPALVFVRHNGDLNVEVLSTGLTGKRRCNQRFPGAGSILETNPPSVPSTDHRAILHDSFRQWEPKVRTEILDGKKRPVPLEKCELEARNPEAPAHAVFRDVIDARNADPFGG